MESIYKLIYAPFQPFLWHPERIAVVAAALFVGFLVVLSTRRLRAWPLFIAAVAWGVLVPWEYWAKLQRANIRVDLLLIWPLLATITGWGLIMGLRPHRSQVGGDKKPNQITGANHGQR